MHDVGTGDGIPVLPTPEYAGTATQIRTAPLWALRTRNRLMHDGLSITKEDAIARHGGQAAGSRSRYSALSAAEKRQLLAFLGVPVVQISGRAGWRTGGTCPRRPSRSPGSNEQQYGKRNLPRADESQVFEPAPPPRCGLREGTGSSLGPFSMSKANSRISWPSI